jgi:hypothetical protein
MTKAAREWKRRAAILGLSARQETMGRPQTELRLGMGAPPAKNVLGRKLSAHLKGTKSDAKANPKPRLAPAKNFAGIPPETKKTKPYQYVEMSNLAETEGFEPSIGLYNPITV